MRKEETKSVWVAVILLAIIVLMSIGFAVYATTLNIGGENNVTVKKALWDIHWNPDYGTSGMTETTGTNYVDIVNPVVNDTSVTFSATLTKPGDIAEFKVQAKNFGTFDAQLTGITMSALDQPYLEYTVQYGSNSYTASTTGLTTALNAGATEEVTVTIRYIQPENASQLPTTGDVTVTATAAFNYKQV